MSIFSAAHSLLSPRPALSVKPRYMGLLPDTLNCCLRMRQESRERFPRHRLVDGENVLGIPGACETRNFTYLARGPLSSNNPPLYDVDICLIYSRIHGGPAISCSRPSGQKVQRDRLGGHNNPYGCCARDFTPGLRSVTRGLNMIVPLVADKFASLWFNIKISHNQ